MSVGPVERYIVLVEPLRIVKFGPVEFHACRPITTKDVPKRYIGMPRGLSDGFSDRHEYRPFTKKFAVE